MALNTAPTWSPGDPIPPGLIPESWNCVDCGVNTAPGLLSKVEVEKSFAAHGHGGDQTIDDKSEVYYFRKAVWDKAGIEDFGGCLCIGCLENRLGRRLKPKDFKRDHPFNAMPGTPRLLKRRGG